MPPDEIRQIPRWSRRYAENRALPQLVLMLVWGFIFFGLFWSVPAAGHAYRDGRTLRFEFWLLVMGLSAIANFFLTIYLSTPSRARRFEQALKVRLYQSEGHVAMAQPSPATPISRILVPMLFAACVIAQVALGERIPDRYQQPFSALYMIPFMLYLAASGKSVGGLSVILWPILYALHAVALLAGAPILFTGDRAFLNMLIPTAGYGALSFLAAHLYSRVALSRLRRMR